MAQHRTKREKIEAQQHRIEKNFEYSLADLDLPKAAAPKRHDSSQTVSTDQKELQHVRTDLKKTLVSTIVVCVVLAVGVFFLR